jgi:hypothetical protein
MKKKLEAKKSVKNISVLSLLQNTPVVPETLKRFANPCVMLYL